MPALPMTPQTTRRLPSSPMRQNRTAGGTGAGQWGGVDPNSSWTGHTARADLERRLGTTLSDADLADARRLTGYDDPTGNAAMTGAQYNTLLREGARRTGGTYSDWDAGGGEGGGTTTPPIWQVEDAPEYQRREYTPNAPYQGAGPYQGGTYTEAQFRAPTAEEMEADPGYQFRLQEGLRALEHSAAGRGMVRGTNTIRGVTDYAQDAASQEYQNVYNRARDTYGLNRDEARFAYGAGEDQRRFAYNTDEDQRRFAYGAASDDNRYGYERGVEQDQLAYAPRLMTWQARNAANQRQGELEFDRNWQREVYNRDDAWRRYTYGTDDEYRRWLENNQNRRFLVGQGNY